MGCPARQRGSVSEGLMVTRIAMSPLSLAILESQYPQGGTLVSLTPRPLRTAHKVAQKQLRLRLAPFQDLAPIQSQCDVRFSQPTLQLLCVANHR